MKSTESINVIDKTMEYVNKSNLNFIDGFLYFTEAQVEQKKWFLDFSSAWSIVNGESNLDSFIMGFRFGANFAYDAFISTETPFEDLLKESEGYI